MYATADFAVTPRPMYPADGRKLPDIYTQPAGPARRAAARARASSRCSTSGARRADIASSALDRALRAARARAAAADADARLPAAPRLRPAAPRAGRTRAIAARRRRGRRGLRRADRRGARARRARSSCCRSTASPRSRVRCTSTARCARPGCSRCARSWAASSSTPAPREAFAVADHQVAHVYVRAPGAACPRSRRCCAALPGVERVLDDEGKRAAGLDHPRSGELVADRRRATAGSPTTTGSTTRARPTSRAPSTSTASPATTRSSCSSTRSSAAEAAHRPRGWRRRCSACAT